MKFRLGGLLEESVVDGPGLRLVVFAQGCSHRCPGCHNPQTHDPAGGQSADTAAVLALLADPETLCTGLTLSGGEPFDQPEAMARLAAGAKALGKSVWVYSGYVYETLCQRPEAQALLRLCDVLVDGPFQAERRSLELRFRGSANQRLIDLRASERQGRAVLWQDPFALPEAGRR